MELLGISSLRPGVENDAKSPRAANYDESKANPYPTLPAVLVLDNGNQGYVGEDVVVGARPQIVEAV